MQIMLVVLITPVRLELINTIVFIYLSLAEDTPNNQGNQDCVHVKEGYDGNQWDDISCDSKRPFVCKYTLSGE